MHMMSKRWVVLTPFLAFSSTYNPSKIHNMLALMLDSCFRFLDVVKTLVGWTKPIHMVAKYDMSLMLTIGDCFSIPKSCH
jgi:hypothetical protein